MAAKIKEGLRDITQGVVERLKGGPKYADNLLGESLQDQLRKATGRELLEPSEELSSQVVDTINQDITRDSKEIVGLLKKRLRNDNPHKQWLTVLLVGRVMRDCASALGSHQEELLQEVARVMARPARQDSSAGKTTRQAAKELLRSYGRAGTSAFRAINRSTLESASASAEYTAAINAAVAREAANVVEEVKALIEQAQANTELLSEMLVAEQEQAAQGQVQGGLQFGAGPAAAAPPGGDDFESEITRELVTEVRELRTLFDAYLEQLQSMSGEPLVDEIMITALEAVDMLDGALALQKDVASNQREIEQQATAPVGAGCGAAAGSNTVGDLIMLDDVVDTLLPTPTPVLATPPSAATAAAAASATKPPPIDPFAGLDPVAIQATLSPSSAPPPSGPVQLAPIGSSGQPRVPVPHSTFPPPNPQQHPQQPYYAYMTQPLSPQQQQQQQQYGVYGAVAPLQAAYPGGSPPPTNNPFATPAIPPTLPVASGGLVPATSGNPFEQVTQSAVAGGTAAAATGGSNPFALPPAASGGGSVKSVMDSEWSMFFANRSAGAAAAQQQH